MRVLFSASECTPLIKTGGLADVLGALPQTVCSSLKKNRLGKPEVVVVLPKYSLIRRDRFSVKKLPGKIFIPVGDHLEEGTVWEVLNSAGFKTQKNFSVYLIGNDKYFDRPGLYRTAEKDFDDNDERFIFFSRAVLEFCKFIDFVPDVVHAHDWQTGLVPAYLKTLYQTDAFFHRTSSVFSIHNIAYQGLFPKETLFLAGFRWQDFIPEKLEYFGQISFLKAALVYADKICTVSPTYAQEVQNSKEFGRGMEGVLKSRTKDFTGIVNGLDYGDWDPAKDPYLAARFSLKSKEAPAHKQICKRDLQQTLRLAVDETVPLIGMVSRLDPQKGFARLRELLPKLVQEGFRFQWVVLGLGDKEIQNWLVELSKQYPAQFTFQVGFKDDLAHKIYGGSDFFFMPSEFEPCGMSQMTALKYGAIPIVTPTGGLLDTIKPWDPKTERGYGFVSAELSTPALLESLHSALKTYQIPGQWEKLTRNAMSQNFSWASSADRYVQLYKSALNRRG